MSAASSPLPLVTALVACYNQSRFVEEAVGVSALERRHGVASHSGRGVARKTGKETPPAKILITPNATLSCYNNRSGRS